MVSCRNDHADQMVDEILTMIWWIFGCLFLSLILWAAFRPVAIGELKSQSIPVENFEDAVDDVKAMQEEDNQDLTRDVCVTKLYEHGSQTEHVIVLIHGFTNCPEQFGELGRQYYDAGYNVFIPRMPFHGLSDRLTDQLIRLTAEQLVAFGDRVIDIAHGLGKKVTVMGISGSGTLVAWLVQNRTDIDFAFAIAPLFGLAFVPARLTRLFERIALLLPNFFLWWDPRTKADNPYSIFYAYPRYPTRALVEIIRLGMITRSQAEQTPPKARNFTLIVNDAEPAVNNAESMKLLKLWQKYDEVHVSEVHFEKNLKLPHDMITPGTPGIPIEITHPRLMSVIRDLHARK
jgi:pimeloyl-ACP methyl ester carboxylesterase